MLVSPLAFYVLSRIVLICIHSIKVLFALKLIMKATPPCCTSSSPTYTTLSPPCNALILSLSICLSLTLQFHILPSLATYIVHVSSAMVLMFQQPMVICFLGATMGHISLWASAGFCPRASWWLQQQHPPFGLYHQCIWFPNLEDQGITLCLVSTLRPVQHRWPYQECETSANIALGVIETCKLPHTIRWWCHSEQIPDFTSIKTWS